jgi:hypothetical protein
MLNLGMLEQMWKTCLDLSLADKGYHNEHYQKTGKILAAVCQPLSRMVEFMISTNTPRIGHILQNGNV